MRTMSVPAFEAILPWLYAALAVPRKSGSTFRPNSVNVSLHFLRCAGQAKSIPDETFVAIETLLPTGKGKFLELWAARNMQRPGWMHIVETSSKHDK